LVTAYKTPKEEGMNPKRGLSRVARIARVPAALAATVAALALGLGATAAHSQQDNFPNKPMRLMLPFGAGGPSDAVSRIFAERVGEYIGQPVIVDNRAGGLGQIGSDAVLAAGADGYTAIAAPTNQSTLYPLIMDPSDKRSLRTFRQDFKLAGLMSV